MGTLTSKEPTVPEIPKTNGTGNSGQEVYYGVYIPPDEQLDANGTELVYSDKGQALKAVRRYRRARFKPFAREDAAREFARRGPETGAASPQQPAGAENGEKPSLFRAPRSQESSCVRRCIEQGDVAGVKAAVWGNPRYLVSSGDTPAIMKEGPRYNALHVAAKAGDARMCNMLLSTVGDPAYLALLYGEEDPGLCEERARILLDLYLNTPDKGTNETPLHFAAKFGAVEAVRVLVSYPQCDKRLRNKWDQAPKDIICSRMPNPSAGLKNELLSLLTDRFYVPILRSEDNSVQPMVGEVFAPDCPPVLSRDPLQPRVEIKAYAGPMDRDQAAVFRKKWKTPPRSDRCSGSPVPLNYRLLDSEKGLERVGRDLANQLDVGWKEYWGFLKTFTDLSSPDGLQRLDDHLRARFQQQAKAGLGRDAPPAQASPVSELCDAFGACSLQDTAPPGRATGARRPAPPERRWVAAEREAPLPAGGELSYVERSSQVFAKRLHDGLVHASVIGREQSMRELALDVLRPEVEHLQALVGSYLLDERFRRVDFQRLHSRIATVVAGRLRGMLEEDLDFVARALGSVLAAGPDSSSSGEDDRDCPDSSTAHRKQRPLPGTRSARVNAQVRCIAESILRALTRLGDEGAGDDEDGHPGYEHAWSSSEVCSCSWQTTSFLRNSRKMSSLKRNQAKKFAVDKGNNVAIEETLTKTESDEEDGCFETPPSSPLPARRWSESESEENLSLAEEGAEVYIEGSVLSKQDVLVLQAIENCELVNPVDFPFVYRWRHGVLLHPPEERARLLTPKGRSAGRHVALGTPRPRPQIDSPVSRDPSQRVPRQLLF
ncbi:ankyrin repeat and LEM domain-containing protein 2 homolog isoform X2 [Bacillus rossius redtenbacheri]|uniref:ankyrin repeat and LEM domain-containing protein 2 homolog isoform X2 n=1 Tax=Bacillus rossius redtenbacheri TaxID=93214 RepID=UPI002FDE1059